MKEFDKIIEKIKKIKKLEFKAWEKTLEQIIKNKNVLIKETSRYNKLPISLIELSSFKDNSIKKFGKNNNLSVYLEFNKKVYYYNYYFELKSDSKKYFLNIYNRWHELLYQVNLIYLKRLKHLVNQTLNNFCLVYYCYTSKGNATYYNYYKVNCYKLIHEDIIVDLIKNNFVGLYLNGSNLELVISENRLNKLFKIAIEVNF